MRIRLERGRLPPPDGETVLPLVMDRGATPSITIDVGPREVPVLIDSTWKGFLSLPTRWAEELPLESPPVLKQRVATLFNEFEIRTATLEGQVRIGSHRMESPELQFNDILPGAILGGECLKHFAVTYDQRSLRIRFVRLAPSYIPQR